MVIINIQKKDLWLFSAIMVFLIGVGFVVAGTWTDKPMWHPADSIKIASLDKSLEQAITDGDFSGAGYKLLATSTDWTEEAQFTITSSGISFDTDHQYAGQRVNPILFEFPINANEIIFEVKNDGDDYCIGGNGVLNLISGIGIKAKCTDFQYQGTTLNKVNSEQDDWIQLYINGDKKIYCPLSIPRIPNSGYSGTYGHNYFGSYCYYSKENGDWTGDLVELKIEEADWSSSFSMWEWKIWYK